MASVCEICQAPSKMFCGKCRSAAYCSKECQKKGRYDHKQQSQPPEIVIDKLHKSLSSSLAAFHCLHHGNPQVTFAVSFQEYSARARCHFVEVSSDDKSEGGLQHQSSPTVSYVFSDVTFVRLLDKKMD